MKLPGGNQSVCLPFFQHRLRSLGLCLVDSQLCLSLWTLPVDSSVYSAHSLTSWTSPAEFPQVIVSSHNLLPNGRYYDPETETSFAFDHITQKASSVQSYTHATPHTELMYLHLQLSPKLATSSTSNLSCSFPLLHLQPSLPLASLPPPLFPLPFSLLQPQLQSAANV